MHALSFRRYTGRYHCAPHTDHNFVHSSRWVPNAGILTIGLTIVRLMLQEPLFQVLSVRDFV